MKKIVKPLLKERISTYVEGDLLEWVENKAKEMQVSKGVFLRMTLVNAKKANI